MATATRDRLIKTAHDLFYRKGFHSVGLDAILDEVGISKTAFYNHFTSKDDLVKGVLDWHDRWWQDTFRDMLRKHGGDSPRDQLMAVFDVLDELFDRDDFNGCFFIIVAVQFPQAHDPAHELAARHKQAMEGIIRELAGYANAADPAALAQEVSLVIEGAYITQQISGRPETSDIARRIGTSIINRHLPQPINDVTLV